MKIESISSGFKKSILVGSLIFLTGVFVFSFKSCVIPYFSSATGTNTVNNAVNSGNQENVGEVPENSETIGAESTAELEDVYNTVDTENNSKRTNDNIDKNGQTDADVTIPPKSENKKESAEKKESEKKEESEEPMPEEDKAKDPNAINQKDTPVKGTEEVPKKDENPIRPEGDEAKVPLDEVDKETDNRQNALLKAGQKSRDPRRIPH
ncbi:hypothetical protein NERG_01941 [Nematocida ausubeli]|uniref:Uncharacterized protein n=1 Tax=Nematocida ausubeli (strain ATCC PRA-371 / ERTm2) TaxID=1913371 RepID=H8ZEC0_NEMA1|nr:hypothetical protein NERG_01941 [Nematocida ausubeli]